MSVARRLVSGLSRLPAPITRDVSADRNISIPMPDGVTLAANRYYPTAEPAGLPLLLTRTPYGRQIEGFFARLYAERGYQVLVVSCRGTFDSGGEWMPFHNERADGRAVLEWVAAQPWFGGAVGLFGGSYVGLTQWSVIDGAPDYVKAWAPTVTSSYFADLFYPGGSFALESALTWIDGLSRQEAGFPRALLGLAGARTRLAKGAGTLPLCDADLAITGGRVEPYQQWLEHPGGDDPWWAPVDFGGGITSAPPASLTAGWYDIFLPYQIADFVALRAAGREARITIGEWHHGSMGQGAMSMRNALDWMDRYVAQRKPVDAVDRVQLQVMGTGRWVTSPEWPPPATEQRWNLHAGGGLSTDTPAESVPATFRYDPADPTPGIGGNSLFAMNAGRKDNKLLEARDDVLVYTSAPMADDLTVAGPVRAELHVRSSLPHTDFFVRLCDVDEKGRSYNICDGIRRIGPEHPRRADGTFALTVELFPTANTFAKGHRIRVQVSSGAHPLYARNLGTGDPLGKGTAMVAADQEVFHDPARPSALVLPVLVEPVRP
ncbi:MAG TPA: CocE/NonD family hydrolase [Mycobacteriales bacterium]|nr:CocE/NonD family hydrolase [Mycobacteriales bacterium]